MRSADATVRRALELGLERIRRDRANRGVPDTHPCFAERYMRAALEGRDPPEEPKPASVKQPALYSFEEMQGLYPALRGTTVYEWIGKTQPHLAEQMRTGRGIYAQMVPMFFRCDYPRYDLYTNAVYHGPIDAAKHEWFDMVATYEHLY